MIEDTKNHNEKELLKLNKNEYKNRFGINYSFKKRKSLDLNNNEFFKMKRYKRYNSKIYISKDSSRYNSLTNNDSSFRGKSTRHNNLYNEKDKIELNKIYGNFEKESEEILPIKYFSNVSNCSIVKYGIKKSPEEIEYSFCKTCDHNLLKPICLSCINQCHNGHSIKYIFNKGRIKCCCGEKNHIGMKIKDQTHNNNNEIKCLCNEWNIIAKLNYYYKNEKNEPVCILCHNFCQDNKDNDKLIKIDENQTIPKCSCKNEEIHNDSRIIYEKILILSSNSNEFDLLLHPIQIINMIFKSTNNFKMIFDYFLVFMNNLIDSNNSSILLGYFSKINLVDVTYTNIYKTLYLFEKIIKKIPTSNDTCFFNEKIIDYFSFHNIRKLISFLKESSIDEKIFLILINKYLYLFHKIYINTKTQSLEKYKLNDLKNLSFCQRIIIFNENKKKFKESEEIVSFLLKFFIDITYKGFSSIESVDCIKEIISIFRKLSCYDLIYISDMTRICVNLYKCFNNLRIIRNSFKKNLINSKMANDVNSKKDLIYFNRITLKIYYIIIKMFMNFIYNYNDSIIKRILYDKEKYTFIHNISLNNVCFIYKKNELGRLIFKITICILTSIQKNYNNFNNKKTVLIQRVGIKIIQFSLIKSDDYILNILDSLNKFNNYFEKSKKIKISNYQYYKELNRYCTLISKAYYQYFNFEISILEMLNIVNDSLNFILGDSIYYIDNILSYDGNEIHEEFNHNQILTIISTNYFSLICKVFNIIYHYQKRKTKLEKIIEDKKKKIDDSYIEKDNIFERNNIIELNSIIQYIPINFEDEIIKKILYFYFCFTLNSSDNSFLILTHYIFNELIKLPLKYCQLVFKLFFFCFKNVLSTEHNNIITAEKSYIIKRLYKYLVKLINEKNIKQNTLLFCVYYFLQLIEITIFNSQSSLFNNINYKIQNMIFSINKNYDLVNKYFDMIGKDINIQIRNNSSKANIFEIKRMRTNVGNMFTNKNKDGSTFGFEFYQRNILKRSIFIFIKLINDCFDFSLETDRKKIEEMINVDKVMFCLHNYKISLDLRTEFMRLLRKLLLDLKYSEEENDLYSKAIIKYKDTFNYIKNNNLINNMGYPTKLLSFLYDFYNITSKCSLKDKLKAKIRNKNIGKTFYKEKDKSKTDKILFDTVDSNKSENLDFIEDINEKTLRKRSFYQNENYLNNFQEMIENGKYEINNKRQSIKYKSMKRLSMINKKNEDSLSEIRKKFYNEVIKVKIKENYKRNESLKDLSIKEKSGKDLEEDEQSNVDKNKYLNISNISNGIILEESFSKGDNDDSDESKLKGSNINKSNKSLIKISDIKFKSQNRLSITKSNDKLTGKFHSSNTLNLFHDSKNQSENKIEEEEKSDINTEDLIDLFYIIDYNDNEDFFWKCRDLNLFEDAFNGKFYAVIINELNNAKNLIKNINLNTPEKIEYVKNYIENGILIPIICYFKKIFTLVSSLSGEEMIKLYSLVEKCLNFKIYLFDFKSNFWKINLNEESSYKNNDKSLLYDMNEIFNPQKYYYSKEGFASIIDESYFIDSKFINSTYDSLDLIKSNKISMFDYSSLYQIIEKEFFVLIKDRKLLNIKKLFKEQDIDESLNKKKIKEEEKLLNLKKQYNSDIQKRLLRTFIIYKYGKIACYNENSSSFYSILSEVSLGYETNYRNLLIKLLINYGRNDDIKNEFVEISYFLLFKLQCAQTMETQNEIINILGGLDSEDCGFLEEFSQILLCRITLLIMDFLNPSDKLFQTNYFVTCNLINIFKYLCIEHNYFFQFHLVKSLSYNSCRNNFSFFKFNIVEEDNKLFINKETEIIDDTKIINKKELYSIKFYDFFLFLLTKIILISNWENNGNNNFNPNPFLFDLFSSILDLLTEIIQGSKPELLSILFDSIDQKIVDILGKEFDPEKFKKTESFEIFTKSIVNILFEEKYDLKLIYEIKNIIMHYITSILEEKNCNETMRKYIKKHLNINNIYAHIIKLMKLYFLNKQNPKKFDKIKKQIAGLIPKKIFIFNKGKPPRKHRNSVVGLESRPKINPILTKTLKGINMPEHSSSKINLISTMIDINKDLKKHLASSKFKKNKIENKHFKNILSIEDNSENNPIKGTKTIKEEKKSNNTNSSLALELKISKLTFGKKLYDYFRKQFYEDPNFIETMDFQLINSFYRFIKIITLKQNNSDKKTTIKNLQKITDLNYEEEDKLLEKKKEDSKSSKKTNLNNNLNYEKDILEKYYIEKFFENITTTVEVRTNEGINKTVIFTRLPAMQLLSRGTKIEFKRNVNRDNETSKKNDLMKYIEYFIKEIKYYKKYNNKWDVWFSKINFNYLELISHFFAIFYNLILLFTIKGDTQITNSDTLKDRRQNKIKIMYLIDVSIHEWNLMYFILNWIYLVLNGIFIFLWMRYKLPLYYREDKINYREIFKIDKHKKLNILEKLYVLIKMCIFGRKYIKMLIYEFILCIICLIIKRSEILYPFLIIPIIFINKTLKNITISIRLNFKQFCLTFCFAFIIIYVFSNLYFFYLNSDFENELNYYNDNYCKTLIFAFLNALDNGLRARGGLGDSAKRISFLKNKHHYLLRLILDDFFFIFIVIIMIDMVFGIIVKSFDELRYRNQKFHSDKKNHCFICHSHRNTLEKMRKDFNEHTKKTHNVWNYVEYMILLKFKDIHDLNAVNQYVRAKMDRKDISWFPTYKDNEENSIDFEDKNLSVYHERVENYKMKTINII